MPRVGIINNQQTNGKRIVCSGLVLVFILLFVWLKTAEPVSADDLGQISFRDKIYDITLNGDEVFVVGFPGILLYSPDRGGRFSSIEVPTNDALFAVDIATDGTGAIVGRDGLVLVTSDGGKRWIKCNTHTKEHLFSVSVVSGGKSGPQVTLVQLFTTQTGERVGWFKPTTQRSRNLWERRVRTNDNQTV